MPARCSNRSPSGAWPRLAARAPLLAAALLLAGASGAAQAQLFPDNEARKAIVELRERLNRVDDAARARIAEENATQAKLSEQVTTLQRSLLELNNQLEALRAEIARQRGSNEQLARDVAELQRKQRDIAQGVDERMRKIEPTKVSIDGKEFLADPEEKRQYEEALAQLRGGDFAGSSSALAGFVRRYPGSGYTESARFWLGNAQYGKRDYKDAIATFRAFVVAAPDSPRAPEAVLAIANCQVEMKDTKSARATINELIRVYPKSEAAVAGRERLATIR